MCVCRTCLAKGDLQPIFSDKNLVNIRTKQLFTVTGVKIAINDGLPQQICTQCSNLIMGALKLREISSKSNEILQNKLKCITKYKDAQISKEKYDIAISDTRQMNIKQISKRKDLKIKSEERKITVGNLDSVRIEDFESSDESQSMNQIYLEGLDSDVDVPKICIEDFESSDSFDGEDIGAVVEMLQEHSRNDHGYQEMRDKQLLERERRRTETQKLDHKLLSLAVSPYDPGGPIRCSLCSTVVKSVPNFKNHAKIHYELKNACEECGKKFLTPSLVRYHQQRVHGRPKRLACTQCAYRAVDSQQLQCVLTEPREGDSHGREALRVRCVRRRVPHAEEHRAAYAETFRRQELAVRALPGDVPQPLRVKRSPEQGARPRVLIPLLPVPGHLQEAGISEEASVEGTRSAPTPTTHRQACEDTEEKLRQE